MQWEANPIASLSSSGAPHVPSRSSVASSVMMPEANGGDSPDFVEQRDRRTRSQYVSNPLIRG